MPLLQGKTGIIFGVANKRSIAWAIAQALSREGMRLAFTYQGERLKEGVEGLAGSLSGSLILPCDVTSDSDINSVFGAVGREFGKLDAIVHSVAFAPREDLERPARRHGCLPHRLRHSPRGYRPAEFRGGPYGPVRSGPIFIFNTDKRKKRK